MKIEVKSAPLPHPKPAVCQALLDPQVLSGLLPGVEKFEPLGNDAYDVEVKLGVGGIRGAYAGKVQLADVNPPDSYTLQGEVKGKPGWARGNAKFRLEEVAEGTVVHAAADAQVGGSIAGVGQRMMEGVAKSMAREFFTALDAHLAGNAQQVGQVRFGFRVFWGMVKDFFARLFGRSGA